MATMAENVIAAGKENGEMLINSIEEGPFQLKKEITIPGVNGAPDEKREQTVEDLSPKEKLRYDNDIKVVNILLLRLPVDIYTLINHYQTTKEIWDRMTMSKIQVNTKFVNHLQLKWSRFITAAKQAKDLHVVNFDQLYDFLKHNEKDDKQVLEMRQ
ncbi:hypothetical protein Tco_1479382 [Tanacetum coccineum]